MRLATRSRLIATALAIGAIAAPNAQAGGLFSTGHDPKCAAQQEAQSFLRIYSHPASTPSDPTSTSAATTNGFDYGDAGVGAGVVGGIALLAAAGGLTVRRRNQVRRS
jgi:hypothetical protein